MTTDSIGVRELKYSATQIVRAVREQQAEYVITVRGQPVAVIRPYTAHDAEVARKARIDEHLAVLDALAHEVGAAWASPQSSVELVEEQRRG